MRFRSVVMASQDTLAVKGRPYQLPVIDATGLFRLTAQAVQRSLTGQTAVLHAHLDLLFDRELALARDCIVKDDEIEAFQRTHPIQHSKDSIRIGIDPGMHVVSDKQTLPGGIDIPGQRDSLLDAARLAFIVGIADGTKNGGDPARGRPRIQEMQGERKRKSSAGPRMQFSFQIVGMYIDTTRGKPLPPQVDAFPVKFVPINTRNDPFFDHDSTGKIGVGCHDSRVRQ